MNNFGGNWTTDKIEILVEYAKAYLVIMNIHAKKYNWELMYFDGFAGSGLIVKQLDDYRTEIIGAARRIIEIDHPISFDRYYFVELSADKCAELKKNTKDVYTHKTIHVVSEDCNKKLHDMANFLNSSEGKRHKVLAFIDPFGMQLEWESIQALQSTQSVDMWILIPTGMGVNRLLKKDGNLSDGWLHRLEKFLGMHRNDIMKYFYTEKEEYTLFGVEKKLTKEERAIEKSAELYAQRLNTVFKYVSFPYILKTHENKTLFHFLMASNNRDAIKIANDIVKKYNTKY